MKTHITNQWIYEASPNEVWEYLTQPELIALWLMPNNFKPEIGSEFEFRSGPIPSLDLDGIFRCKVLELVPNERLVYTWTGGPSTGELTLDTVVEWTLEKVAEGTKLSLMQTGFTAANVSIMNAMTSGWAANVVKMFTLLKAAHDNATTL